MNKKGGFLLFMSLCLILTLSQSTDINALEEERNINIENIIKIQGNELVKYEKIQSKLIEDKNFNDNYAGTFIDELGELNVNYAGDIKYIEKEIIGVKFHEVKYTKKYLEKTQETLSSKMNELGILAMGLDEENNKVIIYSTSEILNKAKIQEIVDIDAIEFKLQELIIQFN
jgi:hypothetical protein